MMVEHALASIFYGCCVRCGGTSLRATCSRCATAAATSFVTPSGLKVMSLGLYDGPSAPLIQRLKYGDETLIATRLGSALARILPPEWRSTSLVPVPLHPERLAERGYNQAALLARSVGNLADLKTQAGMLFRQKETSAQATLRRAERAHNLAGAFVALPASAKAPVLLVDDVVTTGHTVDSCRIALEAAQIEVLGVLACAVARSTSMPIPPETKTE
jgi:ComF family protein